MINATFSPTPATVSTLRSLSAVPAGPLFTEHDFGKVAWQVLLREGKLVRVFGDYATAKSANLTPEDRALALAKAIPAPMVASGVTAAWVYCGRGPLPPAELEMAYRQGHGVKPGIHATVYSVAGLDSVTERIGDLRITNRFRTIADLGARQDPDVAKKWMLAMAGAGVDLESARRTMERRLRMIGRERARNSLREAISSLG